MTSLLSLITMGTLFWIQTLAITFRQKIAKFSGVGCSSRMDR
jgi:hypothetical protein